MTPSRTIRIDQIDVGERARGELGDLTDLMASIKDIGLLQPIVITADRRLIAGGRRIEACHKLGWETVPSVVAEHITDAVTLLKAERDENTCRKDMTVTERLAIAARIEELKRPEAAARQTEGQAAGGHARHRLLSSTDGGKQSAPAKRSRNQETAALAADAVGMSRTTYYMLKAVKKYADDDTQPADIRDAARAALAEMDGTGKFTPVYDDFMAKVSADKERRTAEQPPKAPPLTNAYGRRFPQRSQRKALTEGMAALAGLCAGLASVTDLDESLDAEEVAHWQDDLNNALRVLRSLNTQFKEHLNATR